jgi:hypothetical protein
VSRCGFSQNLVPSLFRAFVTVLGLASVTLAGCGGGDDLKSVSGAVTYQGKPVQDGLINFVTTGSRPLGGGIADDGTYSVELSPGDYQVRVDTPPQFPPGFKEGDVLPKLPPRQVPERFANFTTSGLTARVKADESSQTIDFDIK